MNWRPALHKRWLVLVLGCGWRVFAIVPDTHNSQYVHDRWGSDKGLVGEVRAIAQTSDGYLWIGTASGLFRFDGFGFTPVSDQGRSPLSIANVAGLAINSRGDLMVRLPERNLLHYAYGTFENTLDSLQPRELAVTAMCRDKNGDILVAGLAHGVISYHDGRFETIASINALPPSPIISITQSEEGRIWLGTRDAGLYYIYGKRVIAEATGLLSWKINSLLSAGPDLWVGTDAGLARWDGTRLTAEGVPDVLRRLQVLSMLMDSHSNLWVGTGSGLFRLKNGALSTPENPGRVARAPVNALFEDREGSVWSGGPGGIERWRESNFATYGKPEGLPSDHNGAIYADSDGRTWFAPLEGGLYWLREAQSLQVVDAGLKGDVVYSIAGGNEELWVGRQKGGLTHLRNRGGRFVAETFTQTQGLAENSVYSVYQSRDGTVWAGTITGGVTQYRSGKITNFSTADGLGSNNVADMVESSDGTMWFATPNGLRAFSGNRWRGYTVREGLPSNDVICLAEDSKGILWIGTGGGLAFMTPAGITTLRAAPEPLRDQVLGLAEDKSGWLWIAASNHVVRVNRDKLLRSLLDGSDLREYTIEDGLRNVKGVRRARSVVPDASGRIWFSMSSGLSVVDPAQLTDSAVPVIVHTERISADNRVLDFRAPVRIHAPARRITLAWSGVSLWEPDRMRFRYRLDGYDSGWSEPTADREATYTNLDPDSYRFRVIASNFSGVWSPSETVVGFEVLPLFWQTWWFRLTALLAVGLVLLALYRLRLHRLTTKLHVGFEERLAERTRIAQELHDTLLQGFLSASMQLHVAFDLLPPHSHAKDSLGRVIEQVRQVIDEGRNAVRGLRSSQGASLGLEQAFSTIRQELQVPDEIAFRVIVNGQPRPLHPVLRDEVYRLGREALINAFRHSHAREVNLEIEYAAGLRVLVRDNGCGIDPQVLHSAREGHWGLPRMRERAEKIGGRLRVWSRPSAGTEIELSVPGHVAFQDSSSNTRKRWFSRKAGAKG